MSENIKTKNIIAILVLILLTATISVYGQNYKVEAGERIRVRIDDKLSSKTSQAGDRFNTKVTEPVYSSTGVIVIPNGSTIVGNVDDVTPAAKGGKPGQIDVSFVELRLPNGMTRSISGSLTSLDTDDAKSDAEGGASAEKMKNRKIIFIGGGGAGGAVLGAIIGGGKGAIIGGIIGAGGGLLGERLTKGKEAEVKSGTEFGVYINKEFFLPRYSATNVTETRGDDDRDNPPPRTDGSTQTYVVRPGDTLGAISFRFYGTTSRYMDIYNANRDQLSSPSSIKVGQVLVIP
ncbi:MAG: LysM peptidoglycan-binding domain-containing protein [Acidobacteriota bacterium]|nr:LysM peptidoglycan-binding domain-containing protein [Acidobacteriota bacterium]MDH3530886.1 LysM peptidoglycan-binding domain-containing protein [Acidobacteriota bacterium]